MTILAAPLSGSETAIREEDQDDGIEPGAIDADKALHALCEDWAHWSRTRHVFFASRVNGSLLARLTRNSRPTRGGGPNGTSSAELCAFHLAVISQPMAGLDRRVFELHYVWRVHHIKTAAAELGIGRQHWYTLLREFRRRCFIASREILRPNEPGGVKACDTFSRDFARNSDHHSGQSGR